MDLKKFNSGVKKFVSGTVALTLSATTVLPSASVFAEKAEQKYPYAMFASSDKDGAISVSTAYSSGINGNIATNGTIATNGSFNFNGSKKEHAKEEMIYISKKLSHTYFNTDDVKRFDSDLSFEDVNINIDDPWEVQGSLDLTGNINLNNGIKALSDINIDGNVKNSHDSVIFSEEGDINIDTTNVSFTGLIYAPHGDINIDVDNLNLNSAVIIGETISIDCKNANINYGNNVAEKIGNESDFEATLYAFASYNKENNSLEIKWNSNYEPENYEIWASDDNKKYNSVSVVSNANSYSYTITDDFEKKYFKVSMIDSYGDKIESVPFIVTKTDKGYSVDFLDSDNDGLADIFENMFGTNKNKPDTDDDGLTDYQEIYITGTDPLKYDSVKKGISDADADLDGDGLSNAKEIELGTDPKKSDTDDDSLSDGDEISKYKTDPLKKDTDDDGLEDDDEIYFKTDPKNPDTNGNGVKDGNEYFNQEINNNCFDKDLFDNNLAIPSLSNVIAKGNASKNAEISEYNGYLKGDERVYVGKVIEIKDTDIKSGKLSFTLDKSYNLNEYSLESHTTNGLLICYNDGNTTTPLATNFDAENKTLSADISSDGIYFVLDVMSWCESLGLELSSDTSSEPQPAMRTFSAKAVSDAAASVATVPIKGQVDIVFVIDTTGSMGGYISNVKNNITAFVNEIEEAGITPSFALVDYRDITCDSENSTNTKQNPDGNNWFKNADDFKAEIAKLTVDGGGDTPETAIDALEMARRLNLRTSSQKFFVLVTDAGYKIDNNYGIKSMSEMINLLVDDEINVSVVSNSNYQSTYKSLYESTGGVFANVGGNFKDELLSIADMINEETNSGCWIALNGLIPKIVKLDENPVWNGTADTDKDSLLDREELKSVWPTKYIDVSPFLCLLGLPWDYEYPSVPAYEYYSNPTKKDTDGDGIDDYVETNGFTYNHPNGEDYYYEGDPLNFGLKNNIIGRMTIVSHDPESYNPFKTMGHSFLLYVSFVNDTIDLSGLAAGFKYVENDGDCDSMNNWKKIDACEYKISPNRYISIGNFVDGANTGSGTSSGSSGSDSSGSSSQSGSSGSSQSGSSGGSSIGSSQSSAAGNSSDASAGTHFNIELCLLYSDYTNSNDNFARNYGSNYALDHDTTEDQLNAAVEYWNSGQHYNVMTNNCAEIASKTWEKAFGEQLDSKMILGIYTPSPLKDSISEKEGSYTINFRSEEWTKAINKEVVDW